MRKPRRKEMRAQSGASTPRVLLVSNMYPATKQDTYGVFVRNTEQAIISAGFDVYRVVISRRGRNALEKIMRYLQLWVKLWRTKIKQFDLIHLSYPSHTYLLARLRGFGGAKLVVRLHGHDLVAPSRETLIFRIWRRITMVACNSADAVVVPSEYFKNELNRLAKPKRVEVLPSGGVDIDLFFPRESRPAGDTLIVGYIGRIDIGKGIMDLVTALSMLSVPFHVVIAGSGPAQQRVELLAQDLSVADRCTFLGAVAHERLPAIYRQLDVFVFPTRYREGLANVLLESLACGVPIISSDLGSSGALIESGRTGLKTIAGNPQSIATAISDFARMPDDERRRMSVECRNLARNYSRMEITKRYGDFLRSVLCGR